MNRVQRAVLAAAPLPVTPEQRAEALRLAQRRLRSRECRSWSSALVSAARTVAARHKMMPGPILLAVGSQLERA